MFCEAKCIEPSGRTVEGLLYYVFEIIFCELYKLILIMHPSIQIFFFAIPRYTPLRSALGTERGEGNLFCSPDHGECFAKQNVSNHQGERWRGSCTTFFKLFFVSYISVSKWIPYVFCWILFFKYTCQFAISTPLFDLVY